jgi:hypothetical protein
MRGHWITWLYGGSFALLLLAGLVGTAVRAVRWAVRGFYVDPGDDR